MLVLSPDSEIQELSNICDNWSHSVKEKPPKRVTQKLESRAPRTSLGGYQQLRGQWRKEGCWERWEGTAWEVVGKQRDHGNTQVKWGRVSGRNDEQYEMSTTFKQVSTKVSTEFNIVEVNGEQQREWWMDQMGHKPDCNKLRGTQEVMRTRKSTASTWKWLAVKGKSKTGQLLDCDVWVTGVYGWFKLIGS